MRSWQPWFSLGVAVVAMLAEGQTATVRKVDWTPPRSSLPPKFVQAVRLMLGNGLSDPRGTGELSLFEVRLGQGMGTPREVEQVYGWSLPGTNNAILADGLTYSVIKRLRAATNEELIAATGAKPKTFGDQLLDNHAVAALLLLRGEVSALSALPIGEREEGKLLMSWLQARLRMELAQALGDLRDQDAAQLAGQLATLEAAIEKSHLSSKDRAELRDEDSGIKLLEDCQRRIKSPSPRPDFKRLRKLPQEVRIKQLLAAFDEVNARQTDNPGTPVYKEDPIYKALLDEGEAAIPALIDAMETDQRYSRSIGFWRSYAMGREFIQVRWVAASAIREIWPPSGDVMRRKDFSYAMLREIWRDPVAKRKVRSQHEASERTLQHWFRTQATAIPGREYPAIHVAEWIEPESLIRPDVINNLRLLLGNGLSDPRGTGDLSLFKVMIASEGERVPKECYGWPIRGTERAVLTDGLTYPVVHRIRAATIAEVERYMDRHGLDPFRLASQELWIPLLLIRGDTAAAKARIESRGYNLDLVHRRLHHRLSLELAFAQRDGRDKDALERAQQMAALEEVVKHEIRSFPAIGGQGLSLYRDIFNNRRSPEKFDWTEYRHATTDKKLWLINRALAEVRGGPPQMKGWGSLEEDPIFQELMELGDAAVPMLITAYEKDNRFTRMSRFTFRTQQVVFFSVKDLAKATILSIWPGSKPLFADSATAPAKLREAWMSPRKREELKRLSTFDLFDNSLISSSRDERVLYPVRQHPVPPPSSRW